MIDHHLDKVPKADPVYRLITTIQSHEQAPADEFVYRTRLFGHTFVHAAIA
jgi:hypothetical protein